MPGCQHSALRASSRSSSRYQQGSSGGAVDSARRLSSAVMLVSGARATIQGLQSRADLNGVVVILLSWIPASGRWRARTDAGEVIALKPECLFIDVSKPPICQALWRSSTPPSNPKRRVQTLHHTLGQMAFEANQGFVDAGGVAAVVQIAFGAWPEGGLAASQHWADEVVEVAPHVFHSARRVALSGLADMAAEGEPYVSALVSNALFREAFAPAAASLLSNYRWRQPFASMCCPHDRDQQQYMAERLCNIANCTTLKWAKSVCGGASAADVDASFCSAVAALVLPILHAIPSPVPEFAFESTAESKRAAKALRAARANELDRLLHRPMTREAVIALARAQGQTQMAEQYMAAAHEMLAAPQEPLEQKSDYMADGVARMLYAVWLRAKEWHAAKPIDALWMASVLAAGASAKLTDLMAPFASKIDDPKYARDPAVIALRFWSACGAGTGASQPISQPLKAAKAPRVGNNADSHDAFVGRAQNQGSCAECEAKVPRLKWCNGCHMTGCESPQPNPFSPSIDERLIFCLPHALPQTAAPTAKRRHGRRTSTAAARTSSGSPLSSTSWRCRPSRSAQGRGRAGCLPKSTRNQGTRPSQSTPRGRRRCRSIS